MPCTRAKYCPPFPSRGMRSFFSSSKVGTLDLLTAVVASALSLSGRLVPRVWIPGYSREYKAEHQQHGHAEDDLLDVLDEQSLDAAWAEAQFWFLHGNRLLDNPHRDADRDHLRRVRVSCASLPSVTQCIFIIERIGGIRAMPGPPVPFAVMVLRLCRHWLPAWPSLCRSGRRRRRLASGRRTGLGRVVRHRSPGSGAGAGAGAPLVGRRQSCGRSRLSPAGGAAGSRRSRPWPYRVAVAAAALPLAAASTCRIGRRTTSSSCPSEPRRRLSLATRYPASPDPPGCKCR